MMKATSTILLSAALPVLFSFTALGQDRPDINSFSAADQTVLVNLMMDYIDGPVVQQHCVAVTMTGGEIHSDFDFLPFHRCYLEAMEDYLLIHGHPEFVPLPKWNPGAAGGTPLPFRVVDPDCASFSCDVFHPASSCGLPINWSPNIQLPSFLSLQIQPGLQNDLCDWMLNPSYPIPNPNSTPSGLSRIIEGQGPNPVGSGYHNSVHQTMGSPGGVMGNFRSPAAPIFWLWHAYVDDIWKTWEFNCSNSTLRNIDLYMKDTPKVVDSERDRGEEPNIDNGPMWVSTDIWVRNQADGFTNREHQDPEYHTIAGNHNYVYVQVRNRGEVANAGGEFLKLYWAKAATALSWPNYWNGSITSPAPMGDIVGSMPIPVIAPGASAIIQFQWDPNDPALYAAVGSDPIFWANEPWHFCLLARIDNSSDPMTFPETADVYANVQNNNNIIWKNVSVVDLDPNNIGGGGGWTDDKMVGASIMVGDAWGAGGHYDLVFKNPDHYLGNPVTAEAEVRVTLDAPLWDRWQQAGGHMENMAINKEDRNQLIITGNPAKLLGLDFGINERFLTHVSFNFLARQLSGQTLFDYDVLQTKEDGTIKGGERYHLHIPGRQGFYADAGPDKNVSPNTIVALSAYSIGEAAIYNWYDPSGNLIYTGKDFSVSPDITTKYKLEVIAQSDGVKDYDEIEVKVKENEILTITPNPAHGNTVVNYRLTNATSAYLQLSIPYGNVNNQYILDVSADQCQLPLSGLPPGYYSLVLVVDGIPCDAENVNIY